MPKDLCDLLALRLGDWSSLLHVRLMGFGRGWQHSGVVRPECQVEVNSALWRMVAKSLSEEDLNRHPLKQESGRVLEPEPCIVLWMSNKAASSGTQLS